MGAEQDAGEPQSSGMMIDESGCEGDGSRLSSLQISVRTVPPGGRFAPRNVGAIWIERMDGTFVRTLSRWGKRRAKWLSAFAAASGGNVVDAVTRATLSRHETHEVAWDLRDLTGCEVEPGSYRLRIEVTDHNRAGENATIDFDKGMEPSETEVPDLDFFRDIVLRLQ